MRPITRLTIFGYRLAIVGLVVYWITIFVGTHLPAAAAFSPQFSDKTKHFVAFAGLTLLLCYCTNSTHAWRRFGGIALVVLTYAAIDEITQQFVPRRVPSVLDFLADAAGMMTMLGVYIVIRRWFRPFNSESNPIEDQQDLNHLSASTTDGIVDSGVEENENRQTLLASFPSNQERSIDDLESTSPSSKLMGLVGDRTSAPPAAIDPSRLHTANASIPAAH